MKSAAYSQIDFQIRENCLLTICASRAKLKLLSARCGIEVDKVAEVLGHGIPETPERESSLGRPAVSDSR
jgi:hypothetical protein